MRRWWNERRGQRLSADVAATMLAVFRIGPAPASDLRKRTGIRSARLFAALRFLEDCHLVVSYWQDPDETDLHIRPRKLYRMATAEERKVDDR